MKRVRLIAAVAVLPALSLYAQQDRITLRGNIHPQALRAYDRGPVDPATQLRYMRRLLKPTQDQAAELEQFLEDQRNPSSPDYRHWLTPEEFGERFGAAVNDLSKVASWLAAQGFTVEQTARARNWIAFSGSAGEVSRSFHTEIHRYESDGELHFSNATEPSVPGEFAGLVESLRGLDDFLPKPQRIRRLAPEFNASNGAHYLAPDDLAAIYDITPLYQAGIDGLGQKLVIPGQTGIDLNDIRSFRSQFGLPARDPQLVLTGPDPGISPNDEVEADLDLEWSGAVARNATIIYVYSQNVFDSLQYAIDQNLAPVISLSYGACEAAGPASFRSVAQQANAQGITWMNASGDGGAAGCDYDVNAATQGPSVIFPANIPEVTAVGGTEFNELGNTGWNARNSATESSASGYLPEKAWNDTALGSGIWASGGGASAVFSKPWWQTGAGVPADQARDVPDISLTASGAHDGYLIYTGGSLMSVGGTSASSPSFAGIVTLLNQYLVSKGAQPKAGLGNINPQLYELAQNSTGTIHDITVGDNIVPCSSGTKGCAGGTFGYRAGAGYDLVTGLGSVDAYKLVMGWTSMPPSVGTTTTLVAAPTTIAQSASTQLMATIKQVSGSSIPTGVVTFTAGSTQLGSAPVVISANTATATLTVKGSSLAAGKDVITANFAAASSFSNSTGTVTVTVTVPAIVTTLTLTASPASIAGTGSTQLTATLKPSLGNTAPMGTVTFTAGNTQLGSATLTAAGTSAVATLTASAAKLAPGANSIVATYAGSSGFAGSASSPVTVTVTAAGIATTTSVIANPSTIAQSASTTLTVTVKPVTGSGVPSGIVTFSVGGTTLGTATLTGGSALVSLKGSSLAVGSNSIVASYPGGNGYAAASGTATVSVTPPPVATVTAVTANPFSFPQNGSTQVTVLLKANTGNSVPTGIVTLSAGTAALGSAAATPSGNVAIAIFTVKGNGLALGNNTINAAYTATGNFANSSGAVTLMVTAPASATAITLAASPTNIAQSAVTRLTATVKAASGNAAPTGTVVFTAGGVPLGTAALTASTATVTINGGSLASGANTITASYSGGAGFAASSATITVTVTSATNSSVAIVATPQSSSAQPGWPVTVQVREQAGIATTVTGFRINGTDFSPAIAAFFGTAKLAAHGTLSVTLNVQWSPLPATITFAFSGVDASGHQWSQTVSVATH